MKAKSFFKTVMLAFLLCCIIKCSGTSNEPEPQTTKKITLSANKQTIQANGEDKVIFTIYDDLGIEITLKCNIYVNDKALSSNFFVTNETGTYKIYAELKNNKIKSNDLAIVAIDNSSETLDKMVISANKTRLLADDTDMIVLNLSTKEGADITSSAVFYANGQEIEGRYLKAKAQDVYTVSASINNKKIKHRIQISAFNEIAFKHRIIMEEFTATWCQYCHVMITFLDQLTDKYDDIMHVEMHERDIFSGNFQAKITDRLSKKWGLTGTPSVLISRNPNQNQFGIAVAEKGESYVRAFIQKESSVGLAIENSVEGNNIKVNTYIHAKKSMKGRLAIVLTESELIGSQMNMGEIEHKNVMRNYLPDVMGGDLIQFDKGVPTSFSTQIPIAESSVRDIKNCSLTVVLFNETGEILNVQRTPIGLNIGY